MNASSELYIASGTVTLTGVSNLPGKVTIANDARLNISNTSATTLTLGGFENNGTFDLSGCTSLTTLNFNLGTNRTVNLGTYGSTFIAPATLATIGTISVTEVPADGGKVEISSPLLAISSSGVTYSLTYADGTDATILSRTTSDGVISLTYTPHISGVATDLDWDFTDGENDAFEQAPSDFIKKWDGWDTPTPMTFYIDQTDSTKTGVYIKHHPYVDGAGSFINSHSAAMTVAVVGTMSGTHNTIFLNVGSAYENQYGLLLATTGNDNEVVVGYNYGGTVTPLTTMTVPNASTARHVYIVTKEDSASYNCHRYH